MEKVPPPFGKLVGEELSGITFVRDYLQLQFNPPPTMNVLTPIFLDVADRCVASSDDDFVNTLIAQIGKYVEEVLFSQDEFLKLVFSDKSSIKISLKPDDRVGAEALIIDGKNNEWGVL